MTVYFIGGIDTDVGKSYATGMMARYLLKRNISVITQKLVQTGVESAIADDLWLHRKLMGIAPQPRDIDGTTCRELYKFPASPHLAATREKRTINLELVTEATAILQREYEIVLLEGAGGMHVPLTSDYLTVDYVAEQHYPLILVTSGRLGSINHTLMSLETAAARGILIAGIVFNHFFDANQEITADALKIFRSELKRYGCDGTLIELPAVDEANPAEIDFGNIFERGFSC